MSVKNTQKAITDYTTATRILYDALITFAQEDSGVRNRNDEEPGITLVKDIEFQVNSRLNFLHGKHAQLKDWAENSQKRCDDAERVKLEVESLRDQLDEKQTRDGEQVDMAGMDSVVTQYIISVRYAELGAIRFQQVDEEYTLLCELYQEMHNKEFVPSKKTDIRTGGSATLSAEVLKAARAS